MNKRKVQVVIFRVASNNEKQFLLLKMNEKRGFFWQNITGGVEKSEDFKAAALREAKEETKVEAKEESKVEAKEEPKEEIKEDSKEEIKE